MEKALPVKFLPLVQLLKTQEPCLRKKDSYHSLMHNIYSLSLKRTSRVAKAFDIGCQSCCIADHNLASAASSVDLHGLLPGV